jgi:hypothetical protein
LQLLLNISVLAISIRQEKEVKWIQMKENCPYLHDMIVYAENPKKSIKHVELTHTFGMFKACMIKCKN